MNVLVEFVTVTKTITKTENNAADLKGGKNPRKTHFKSNNRHPQIFIYFFILDLKTVSVSHSIVIINIYIYLQGYMQDKIHSANMQTEVPMLAQNKDIQIPVLSTTVPWHTLSVRQVSTQEPVSILKTTLTS